MKLADNDFVLFGLPERFALDRADLDARWRKLQASAHPDKFAAEGTAAQRVAMQWSVRINQAHRRLRDPIARASYLCELRGAPIAAESNTAMPADFLRQQMSWREALDDADDGPTVAALESQVRSAEAALLEQLAQLLDEQDQPALAAERVRSLMFIARFRSDIAHKLEKIEP